MKNDKKNLAILATRKFAPFENDSGWAEPFISQLVLYDNGFNGDLFLVNDYPPHSYAPKEVFDRTYNFDEFKIFLKEYFNDKNKSCPIILDDSRLSICLIGVKFNYDEKGNEVSLELLILDPHAHGYIPGESGIYVVVLESNGSKITTLPEEILGSHAIFFDKNKPWMVYASKIE